mmetsp:Transcript_2060/g.4743  ORF Transcript_2060/g.4743 Transcript_2060/m.4743 type:complete len:251 (+) Transcript_2060:158-910(+)
MPNPTKTTARPWLGPPQPKRRGRIAIRFRYWQLMMPVVVVVPVRRSRGGSVQSRRSIGGTIRRWSGAPIIGSSWSGRRRRRRSGWRGANPRLGGMVGVEVVPWQQPLRVPLLVVPLPPPVVLPPLPIWPICPVPSGLMRNPAMPYPRWYWSFGRSERPNGRRRGRRRQGRRPPPGPPRLPRAGPPPVAVRRKKVGRRVVVEVVGARRRRRRRRRRKGVRNHRRHRRRRRRRWFTASRTKEEPPRSSRGSR